MPKRLILALAALSLAACSRAPETSAPTPQEADAFIAGINQFQLDNAARLNAAFWIGATYINDDSQLLSSTATAELLEYSARKVEESKRFNGVQGLAPETARSLMLLKNVSAPAPSDPALQGELATLMAKMEANYGSGKWCPEGKPCMTLQEIEKIINNTEFRYTPEQIAEAWAGWHATAKPIRADYQRFVELVNTGAREMGFANTGEVWRGGYDMSPAEFEAEVERLWSQVEPLYEELHCHVRERLNARYGNEVVPREGLIPAHLLGNMWAQQWGNLYPLMEPYKGVGDLDVSRSLRALREAEYRERLAAAGKPDARQLAEIEYQADRAVAVKMTELSEDFYTSLGFPKLPESFYEKSLLVQPRDRDVVCHASAWDLNYKGDVRIKQCIEPDEDQLTTIHHELGHIYYYLMYNHLPPMFQTGAHDGFHEAIGDTITLSLTPAHLQKIGLVKDVKTDEQAVINQQMKLALDKITFLPWGKLVDQWRWKVFSGELGPDQYNQGWWDLRAQYQGVAPPLGRSETDFDPGAKYHIPGNTPYTRYFLAFVLQFQFQKALCEAAGHRGPLHECDIYGNAEAGKKLREMLALGASQPWPVAMEKITGQRQMDATALVDYFAPLRAYLKTQNQGKSCGWASGN
ncbi:MAG: M2 family metallopeptidase [Gammaproteobacteria bacterium]